MKGFFCFGKFMLSAPTVLFALAMPLAAHAQSVAAVDVVKQAVAAVGGVQALRSVKGLSLKADVQFWEPQQSYVAGTGQPRFIGDFEAHPRVGW